MSFEYFEEKTRNLFFNNEFTLDRIKKFVNEEALKTYFSYSLIFGLNVQEIIEFGPCTLFPKEESTLTNELGPLVKNIGSYSVKAFFDNDGGTVVKTIIECVDPIFASEFYAKAVNDLVNYLRFIIGIKNQSYLISTSNTVNISSCEIHVCDSSITTTTGGATRNFPIDLTKHFLLNDEENELLSNLFTSGGNNKLEKSLLKAIEWIGISVEEKFDDIAIAELTMGFESIFKIDSSSMISKGIQSQIAESVTFLCGKSFEERIEIQNEFIEIYKYRSSIAHGDRKENSTLYNKAFSLLRRTIISILINYRTCCNVKELYQCLEISSLEIKPLNRIGQGDHKI